MKKLTNKKIGIIILSIIIVLVAIIGILMFTSLGSKIRYYLYDKIKTPKETIKLEKIDNVTITYTYSISDGVSFDVNVEDEELINLLTKSIQNKKLNNYSSQIGLVILGDYTVDLGNNIKFCFDKYNDNGFVMMYYNNKSFLTKINPEILSKVISIVDLKLTENIEMFKTDKITVSQNGKTDTVVIDIEEKTAIDYILNQCKNIFTKEIDYEPSIIKPDYEIDFNNNIKLFIYNEQEKGWILKDGVLSEAYGLNVFDTILENAFNNISEKKEMFTADKITITDANKSIEITDKDKVEKITTSLIYSSIATPNWLETYDITEEYNNGIKIKINEYEFLIPGKIGSVTIGNRYVIAPDKKISLCLPLQELEQYANELLENKVE
jgi:hypothetical protein